MMNSPSELRDRPVFICGHPKAGTSLVRAVLDWHPQLVVYPEETTFFRRYLPQAAGLGLEASIDLAEKRLIHIFTWDVENPPDSQAGYPDRDYTTISFDEVRQVVRELLEAQHRHAGDVLSAVVLAYGAASQQLNLKTKYWVEKSPYNEYYAAQIFDWWPAARCLHVVRDPRDTFVSYRRKHPDWRAEFFANNWKRSTQAGLDNQEYYGKERYLLLRYEDLVISPLETIKQLTAFLEIEWHESLTQPTRAGQGWAGNSMFDERFQGISPEPVTRWKDELSFADAAVIELMTEKLVNALDYETPLASRKETTRALRSQSTRARWRVITWPLRKRFYHRRKGNRGQ